jgi:hypothetical protein
MIVRNDSNTGQETYGKLVDTCILIAGGSFEQGNWIKIPGVGKDASGRLTPILRCKCPDYLIDSSFNYIAAQSDTALVEKRVTITITEENTKPIWGPELIERIEEFLVKRGIPNFRRFLADTDRITAVSTNLVYYIVAPAMKSRSGYVSYI